MAGNPFKKYGLTQEGFNRLLDAQNGRCKICNEPPRPRKRLVVDHDHKTGAVRGLLCSHCNSGIGFFRDNTSWLLSAINYLDAAKLIQPKQPDAFDIAGFIVLNQGRVKSFGLDDQGKLISAAFFPESVQLPAATPEPKAEREQQKEQSYSDADLALSPPAGMLAPPPPEEQN